MKNLHLGFTVFPIAAFSAAVPSKVQYTGFPPDQSSLTKDGAYSKIPLAFNFTDTQHAGQTRIDGSFWANLFVRGSDGHDYYIACHVQDYASDIEGALQSYRAALLDITDPSFYRKFVKIAEKGSPSFWDDNGNLNASFDGLGFETSSTEDPLQGVRMHTDLEGIEYDLTWSFSSPAILNAALGSYWVGGDLGFEYSVPKAATSGWFMARGERIEVIPELSSTWYDRQWASLQDSFQWIAMIFEESDWLDIEVLVNWDWKDAVNGPKEFATLRSRKTGRDSVVPMTMTESTTNFYTSAETGIEYPLEWVVKVEDIEIFVTTPRDDQIFEAPLDSGFPPQFSGYVDIVAKKAGHPVVKGYGAVDWMTIP